MSCAMLSLMGPAAGRLPDILDVSAFLAAPIMHDWLANRRVHPANWAGFGLVLAAIPLNFALRESAGGAGVLEGLLGPRGAPPGWF